MDFQKQIAILNDPQTYELHRLPARADFRFFSDPAHAEKGFDADVRQSLNGIWKFEYAAKGEEAKENFWELSPEESGFGSISVPSNVEMQGYGKNHYVNTMYPWDGHEDLRQGEVPRRNPVGSYLRAFRLPAHAAGKKVHIAFEGVQSAFFLWVNGSFAGYSEGSFTTAEFDISPLVRPGENTLAVRVYKYCSGSWLEDQDYWRLFGIFRNVWLNLRPRNHVEDLSVRTRLQGKAARVEIQAAGSVGKASVITPDGKNCPAFPKTERPLPWKFPVPGCGAARRPSCTPWSCAAKGRPSARASASGS